MKSRQYYDTGLGYTNTKLDFTEVGAPPNVYKLTKAMEGYSPREGFTSRVVGSQRDVCSDTGAEAARVTKSEQDFG